MSTNLTSLVRSFCVAPLLGFVIAHSAHAQTLTDQLIVEQAYPTSLVDEWVRDFDEAQPVPKRLDFVAADLLGTGAKDHLVAVYSNGYSGVIRIISKQFGAPVIVGEVAGIEGNIPRVGLLDLDNDRRPEIVIGFSGNSGTSPAWIFQWRGQLSLISPTRDVHGRVVSELVDPTFEDVDSNGTLEIINHPESLEDKPDPILRLVGDALLPVVPTLPTITWSSPAPIFYGTPIGAQLNATTEAPGTLSYVPSLGTILNAGLHQQLTVNFTPDNRGLYTTATASVTIDVLKATPTLNWPAPANVPAGTTLGATQLNATASVPGTFMYSPAAGTTLQAGANQGLTVTFTPADAANYNVATLSTSINVLPQRHLIGSGYNSPESAAYRASFSVDAAGPTSLAGAVKYSYTRTRMNFVSSTVSSYIVNGSAATMQGAGTVNGASGFTYTVTATDGATDAFGIVIRRADGSIYYSAPSLALAGGSFAFVQ